MKILELRPPRFVASLLALTSFGSYNRRICGSLTLAQICCRKLHISPERYIQFHRSHTEKKQF